jgi:hypothetical protein
MAAILSVTYTPNYIGCHRICFRTSEVNYCCYLDESPVIIGTPKTVDINLTDDYADCLVTIPTQFGCNGGTIVEGYVQACCVEESSEEDRIPFDNVFDQTECTPYSVECNSSGIGEIKVYDAGYGWPVGVTPIIEILDSSGDGTGFTGYATMDCLPGENFCSINDIVTTNPGENYFDLGTLTVNVIPSPSCITENLLLNGDFDSGFTDWTISSFPDSWFLSFTGIPNYNIPIYGPTGGSISQNILDPGKTYIIDFEKVIVETNTGVSRFIVSAGTFDPTGLAANQHMITINAGDPNYDAPLSITLTCLGSTEFSIYGDSSTVDPLNRVALTAVSVVEICDAVEPDVQVTSLESCGTFRVPDCAGNPQQTQYALRGGSLSVNKIIVCSGNPGPIGAKYDIVPNGTVPVTPGECLNTNGEFTPCTAGWTTATVSDHTWKCLTAVSTPAPMSSDSAGFTGPAFDPAITICQGTIAQNGLIVPGNEYEVTFDLLIEDTPCLNGSYVQVNLGGVASTVYSTPGYYPGLTFSAIATNSNFFFTGYQDCKNVVDFRNMYIDNVCLRLIGTPSSCCDCKLYNIIVRNPIDVYYTSCNGQGIEIVSVEAGAIGVTVCAIEGSVWPANPDDNAEILAINDVGICTENP